MRQLYDINRNEVGIGDLILYAINSNLEKSYVLGFTENHIVLSCYRSKKIYYAKNNFSHYDENPGKGSIRRVNLPHNAKCYVWSIQNCLILEKDAIIPDNLVKFIKNK